MQSRRELVLPRLVILLNIFDFVNEYNHKMNLCHNYYVIDNDIDKNKYRKVTISNNAMFIFQNINFRLYHIRS